MSDALPPEASEAGPPHGTATAGGLLRAARQARGLHIAALAASIKVTQRKLESLESDRYHELPDITFTRALAKTVCRSLKIDAEPVLALLPRIGEPSLDRVNEGLNTKFRERPGRMEPTDLSMLTRPTVWLPLLLVLAAVWVYFMPQNWLPDLHAPDKAASAASGAPASASAAPVAPPASAPLIVEPVPAIPPEAAPASAVAAADLTGTLQLRVSGESWVEIVDASGAVVLQRKLEPGEAVGLDGTPPFKVKIGNAAATQLSFRGQPVELAAATRDNVARLELK